MARTYIDDGDIRDECRELMHSLPKEVGLVGDIYSYQGFRCPPKILQGVLSTQKHFQARDTDLFLASIPKSGATWLKALTFAVVNRRRYKDEDHPLRAANPHELIPFLEIDIYGSNQIVDVTNIPSPRIFSTYVPYSSLPKSVIDSGCRVVYMYRNPRGGRGEVLPRVVRVWALLGPLLGYWREIKQRPNRGFPFSPAEEEEGVVDEISRLCSFENLSSLKVNKKGVTHEIAADKFFRRGEVGDYVNHLTDAMIERINHMEMSSWRFWSTDIETLNHDCLHFPLVIEAVSLF